MADIWISHRPLPHSHYRVLRDLALWRMLTSGATVLAATPTYTQHTDTYINTDTAALLSLAQLVIS